MPFHTIRIISSAAGWGPEPERGTPDEQCLVLFSSGLVEFTEWGYARSGENVPVIRAQEAEITEDDLARLQNLIDAFCVEDFVPNVAKDIGAWHMSVVTSDGAKRNFSGSMCGGVTASGTDFGDFLRNIIPIEHIWVFDTDFDDDNSPAET